MCNIVSFITACMFWNRLSFAVLSSEEDHPSPRSANHSIIWLQIVQRLVLVSFVTLLHCYPTLKVFDSTDPKKILKSLILNYEEKKSLNALILLACLTKKARSAVQCSEVLSSERN